MKHSKLAPLRHRWAAWCWIALSAVVLTACGYFGGDEPGDAGAGIVAPDAAEASEEAEEEAEAEQESVIEVPLDAQPPIDEESDLVEEEDWIDAGELPQATAVSEDEADAFEQECWWETDEGGDVFSEYVMANVVCTVRVPGATDSNEPVDAFAALSEEFGLSDEFGSPGETGLSDEFGSPGVTGVSDEFGSPDEFGASGETGSPVEFGSVDEFAPGGPLAPEDLDLLEPEREVLEARFGWRCSAGETGESIDSYHYLFEHSGRLEVFASNGASPKTLQFENASQAREAAVVVRFGSDHHPYTPSFEVDVPGMDVDAERPPSAEIQRITYGMMWRNSEDRPPRDRAGVLSVLEDRSYGGRVDPDEWETSQEHSRHAEHLLYAPDDLVDPITASLVRDTTGRLHTALAGVYIDFDISGWEEHVGPVLERCGFKNEPREPLDPVEPDDGGALAEPDDGGAPAESDDGGAPAESDDGGAPAESDDGAASAETEGETG